MYGPQTPNELGSPSRNHLGPFLVSRRRLPSADNYGVGRCLFFAHTLVAMFLSPSENFLGRVGDTVEDANKSLPDLHAGIKGDAPPRST